MTRAELPSGTVTFLFTDVEGSTRLLHELGAERYAEALAEHRRVLRDAFGAHRGVEVDTQGDAFFVAFPTAPGALAAAAEALEGLEPGPIRVRMGIHTGTPHAGEEGYVGVDVHRAARIAAAGHGGQVLVSAATAALLDEGGLRDLGEHRLKDLSAPERIFQLGKGEFPPLASLHQTNLPVPATPFLGRERELEAVLGLLAREDIRLLTLTGPGGTGKTRLALQAAAARAERYPGGVWWVPLAPLRDAELVLEAAAQALGARDGLAEHIGDKRLLVLFDNFEQVVEAAGPLGDLLGSCPGLEVLVTSREPLHLSGEQEYPVPPLAPEEGVGFFLARARAVDPGFQADDAVSAICRRLDQLPLALELAAARVKALTARQILERLERRLPMLTGGARDQPERQRTLRATIEWSHDLLTPEEQQLFARLAVFSGGCTLETAEQVVDAELDTLQSLVDKSLVRSSGGRYWMLETIREYAREQLDRSGEAGEVEGRHGRWCLELAGGFKTGTPATDVGAAAVERERDNIGVALERAVQSDEPTLLLGLVAALWHLWDERSQLIEGQRWAEAALERSGNAPSEVRIEVMYAAARFAGDRGQFERAEALLEDVRALAVESGNDPALAASLAQLGRSASLRGNHHDARRLSEQAVMLRRAGDDPERLGGALYNLGLVLAESGDAEESLARFREAGEILAAEGSEYGAAVAQQGIGWAHLVAGEYATSLTASAYGIRLMRPIGDTYAVTLGLANISTALMRLGLWEEGTRLGGTSDAQEEESGYVRSATSGLEMSWADELEAAARSALGDAEYDRIKTEGATLELDAAVDLALELAEAHGAPPG